MKSMTGFGRNVLVKDGFSVTAEIKSVNHRYFEFSSKIPSALSFLEDKVKAYVHGCVTRGKVEVKLSVLFPEDTGADVSLNKALVLGYQKALSNLSREFGFENNVKAADFLKVPNIFSVTASEVDDEYIWSLVKEALDGALLVFLDMRQKEGEKLKLDIENRLGIISDDVSFIENQSPITVKNYREKLFSKMQEVLNDAKVDENRILLEAAVFADKVAVDEETVRLKSHIEQMRQFLNETVPVGKKMDFLVQEFNREANTIGSKCQDVLVTKKVIEIKAEIEKMREQIQNIE